MGAQRRRGPNTRSRLVQLGSGSTGQTNDGALEGSGTPRCGFSDWEPRRSSDGSQRLLAHFVLWFPARPGPWRTRTATVGGRKVSGKVQVDELPPSQNDRLHHHTKAKWVAEWREVARGQAQARGYERLERARVSVVVYRHRLGTADPTNDLERCKPLIDGLQDAGVLAGDTYRHLEIGTIEERRGDHGILLTIDEIEQPADDAPVRARAGERG